VAKTKSVRDIDPIVTAEWLAQNIRLDNLVVIDIRSAEAYVQGHIPGAISAPFQFPVSAWITEREGLFLELPAHRDLFETIGSLGINADSWVAIVTAPDEADPAPYFGLANATRVADTLLYAGVANVAILDGGYAKWVYDGNDFTTEPAPPEAVRYEGIVDTEMFVTMDYVYDRLNHPATRIIDARDADTYFGAGIEPWTAKAGHIPGAVSLPSPWIWALNRDDGTYRFRDPNTLAAMAAGVLDTSSESPDAWKSKEREIIVYCGVGGYASSWWFILTQVLAYTNVKFYNGAAQEWGLHNDMVAYRWE
jgi:thiosulfate/3-mercaptopyruvate sulfurtransferase